MRRFLLALPLFALFWPMAVAADWRQGWGLAARPAGTAADTAPAQLRLRALADGWQAQIENRLYGPLEYALTADADAAVVGLPATGVASARQSVTLPGLGAAHDGSPLRVTLRSVPGDPRAQARAFLYALPFAGAPVRVSQPPHGAASHRDPGNAEAVDFALPVGTPVLAARAGTVMQVQDGFPAAGADAGEPLDAVNLIRVLHEDGSMAVYAHLLAGAMRVRPGQAVSLGQRLGHSGNSGQSSGPHLHFAVQLNRGMRLQSIPLRIGSDRGELRFTQPEPGSGPSDPAAGRGPL